MPKNAIPVAVTIADALEARIIETFETSEVPLKQAEIAAEFGVSHIPVREALAALANKGLLRIYANRGAFIVPLTPEGSEELGEIRAALEGMAIERAIGRHTADDLDSARAALRKGARARAMNDRSALNWDFHRALYRPAGMPFLTEQLERLWAHADRYLRFAWRHGHYERRSDAEHEAILDACVQADARQAGRLTRAHILDASRTTAELLRQRAARGAA